MDETERKPWKQIVEIEPRLHDLYIDAKAVKDLGRESFCANVAWYRKLKPRLVKLVGFDGPHAELKNVYDYDTAYQKVYNALPDCRNCSCF